MIQLSCSLLQLWCCRPIDTVCQSTTAPFALTGESPSGGTFSGPGVTGNIFDPALANIGVNVIVYTYTDGNGCTGTISDTIVVDVCTQITGNVSNNIVISIYPNPSGGEFVVNTNLENATVTITDVLGKVVEQKTIVNNSGAQFLLDADGVYFVTVSDTDGRKITQKLW